MANASTRIIHLMDVPCDQCGAKVNQPCKKARYPHQSRYTERNRQRELQKATDQ